MKGIITCFVGILCLSSCVTMHQSAVDATITPGKHRYKDTVYAVSSDSLTLTYKGEKMKFNSTEELESHLFDNIIGLD